MFATYAILKRIFKSPAPRIKRLRTLKIFLKYKNKSKEY